MRLVIETCRKVGLPEYSSVGALARIELDVSDSLDAQAIFDQCRILQEVADRVVDARLARPEQPSPAPAREPACNGNPHATRPRADDDESPRRGSAPQDGRQLVRWARDHDEREGANLFQAIVKFGKDNGYQGRVMDWGRDEVASAYDRARRILKTVNAR